MGIGVGGWPHLGDTPFEEGEFYRLWMVATTTYGVGDVVTTVAVLGHSPHVDEMNALLRGLVAAYGKSGLVGLKLAVFLLCLAVSVDAARRGDRLLYYFPPAALAVVGAFITSYNLRLLVG